MYEAEIALFLVAFELHAPYADGCWQLARRCVHPQLDTVEITSEKEGGYVGPSRGE